MVTSRVNLRKQRQQQTREQLLTAASRVFARHGFTGASVPRIAAEAGVSTGAIYSNFEGKEQLFLALLERVAEQGARQRASILVGEQLDTEAALQHMAEAWVATVDDAPDTVLLMVEFWLYAIRRPETLELVAGFLADVRAGFAATIERLARLEEQQRDDLASAVQALAYGFALQRLTDPHAASPQQFHRSVAWLVAGATAPEASSPGSTDGA